MENADDERFMRLALREAQNAFDDDEIPVGAVVVVDGRVVARAHNLTQRLKDATAHAEMQAITIASSMGGKYLTNATLYVTLEPCVMCAGALAWTQIARIVYGATDSKRGYKIVENCLSAHSLSLLHPKTKVTAGVLEDECAQLLKDFFSKKR